MNDYNDLKKQWQSRSPSDFPVHGPDKIIKMGKAIKKGQIIAQIVLATTCLVLLVFFFYIGASTNKTVTLGLLLMIGSLLVRIAVEFAFTFQIKHFRPDQSMYVYTAKLERYYKSRLVISYFITPILFISYIAGFVILLPFFKQSLSAGFYDYVFYSSWIIFIILAVFIGKQIRKELRIIQDLKTTTKPQF